ncbi:MAG: electron transfer flavoprotein subunit beta/FixA family protein [Proteobacteria bacterium]|nr:electron transfer flavoprotein subunit beta/FixA family protein [Pseudomonadota bacterium]
MDVIVCIKQVPDTRHVRLDPETNTLKREGVESMVNPFDMYAIETALRLKDEFGGTVTALTMGPPQAEAALRQVVEYGVDRVALLSDRAFAGADTWATGYTLAKGVEKLGAFDLIVCGKQAVDGDTAQVGPGLAERLGLPFVAFVRRLVQVDPQSRSMTVERLMDDGYDVVETPLPALITVVKEIGEIRVPSLKGKMKAKKIEVPVYGAAELGADPDSLGLAGSPTRVVEVFAPKPRGNRVRLEGSPEEQADRLIEALRGDKLIAN